MAMRVGDSDYKKMIGDLSAMSGAAREAGFQAEMKQQQERNKGMLDQQGLQNQGQLEQQKLRNIGELDAQMLRNQGQEKVADINRNSAFDVSWMNIEQRQPLVDQQVSAAARANKIGDAFDYKNASLDYKGNQIKTDLADFNLGMSKKYTPQLMEAEVGVKKATSNWLVGDIQDRENRWDTENNMMADLKAREYLKQNPQKFNPYFDDQEAGIRGQIIRTQREIGNLDAVEQNVGKPTFVERMGLASGIPLVAPMIRSRRQSLSDSVAAERLNSLNQRMLDLQKQRTYSR